MLAGGKGSGYMRRRIGPGTSEIGKGREPSKGASVPKALPIQQELQNPPVVKTVEGDSVIQKELPTEGNLEIQVQALQQKLGIEKKQTPLPEGKGEMSKVAKPSSSASSSPEEEKKAPPLRREDSHSHSSDEAHSPSSGGGRYPKTEVEWYQETYGKNPQHLQGGVGQNYDLYYDDTDYKDHPNPYVRDHRLLFSLTKQQFDENPKLVTDALILFAESTKNSTYIKNRFPEDTKKRVPLATQLEMEKVMNFVTDEENTNFVTQGEGKLRIGFEGEGGGRHLLEPIAYAEKHKVAIDTTVDDLSQKGLLVAAGLLLQQGDFTLKFVHEDRLDRVNKTEAGQILPFKVVSKTKENEKPRLVYRFVRVEEQAPFVGDKSIESILHAALDKRLVSHMQGQASGDLAKEGGVTQWQTRLQQARFSLFGPKAHITSTETEHGNDRKQKNIEKDLNLLAPGGLLFFTAPSQGRFDKDDVEVARGGLALAKKFKKTYEKWLKLETRLLKDVDERPELQTQLDTCQKDLKENAYFYNQIRMEGEFHYAVPVKDPKTGNDVMVMMPYSAIKTSQWKEIIQKALKASGGEVSHTGKQVVELSVVGQQTHTRKISPDKVSNISPDKIQGKLADNKRDRENDEAQDWVKRVKIDGIVQQRHTQQLETLLTKRTQEKQAERVSAVNVANEDRLDPISLDRNEGYNRTIVRKPLTPQKEILEGEKKSPSGSPTSSWQGRHNASSPTKNSNTGVVK